MTTTTPTTKPASLFELTSTGLQLQAQIEDLAAGLSSDDPEEQAAAVAAVERALLDADQNQEQRDRKASAYCYVIGQLRAQAEWRRSEAKRIAELAARSDREADRLQDSLIGALLKLEPEAKTFNLPAHQIRSTLVRDSLVLDPEITTEDVEPEFRKVTTRTEISKTAIKEALKEGREVEGASLRTYRSWRLA